MSTSDEMAVASLMARIAQLADDGDVDDYVRCFTEDARWDMPGAPRRGRADIRNGAVERRATGGAGPGSCTRHSVSTIAVSVVGDAATATAYWQFWASTTTAPVMTLLGRYDDAFVRTPDGWQLDHRVITFG